MPQVANEVLSRFLCEIVGQSCCLVLLLSLKELHDGRHHLCQLLVYNVLDSASQDRINLSLIVKLFDERVLEPKLYPEVSWRVEHHVELVTDLEQLLERRLELVELGHVVRAEDVLPHKRR